ncbi:MAG: hypothetical protein HYV07_11385 [Deltaproteobacteria bacterium]|nr:hypothetical protein [Deltaproteobacteria bacterium]
MKQRLDALLAGASERVPGLEFNRRCSELRAETLERFGVVSVYELVISKTGDPYQDVLDRILPRVMRLLDDRGDRFPGGGFIIVPLWHDDHAFVFDSEQLFRAAAALEGISIESLEARLRGRSVLALGPGPSEEA